MKRIRQELKCVQRQRKDTNMKQLHLHHLPHFIHWRKTYGPVFLYSTGTVEILHVAQPEIVKDMGRWTTSELAKPHYLMRSPNGDLWAYEKKILAPEFFMEKIKGMIGLIVDATVPLLQAWENILDGAGGRACFGSSFTKGEDIFCKLRQLQKAISQQDTFVGLSALCKYLPTKSNREIRKLNQEVRLLILDLCKEHRSRSHGNDVIHMSTQNTFFMPSSMVQIGDPAILVAQKIVIVDNRKIIYFAGHETAAVTAHWCLMLLAAPPRLAGCARAEVLEVCRGQTMLDIDTLRQLKNSKRILTFAILVCMNQY
ncbi:hypothetical protein HU200_003978 [Digitaria exilis]|uniref:Cytochrome P450 n=1 Tax=Digitaria exilis TaxID=1010633 RepID=A0A835FWQ8_9POAL|nr:hypothetical protein HU200_003978 [Digitaria exilis]